MNSCMTILGRRRQGKSTLALRLALARSQSIIIMDVNRQYRSIPASPFDAEYIQDTMAQESGCLMVFRPEVETLAQDWHFIAEALWEWEDYALILDEASEFQSAGWRDPWLEKYLRQAPDSVSLIMTTHRAVDFSKLSRALSSDIFIFQTRQESDIALLESEFPGIRTDIIQNLPAYHVLHHWLDHGGIPKNNLWNKPDEWFIDIGGFGRGKDTRIGTGTAA